MAAKEPTKAPWSMAEYLSDEERAVVRQLRDAMLADRKKYAYVRTSLAKRLGSKELKRLHDWAYCLLTGWATE
jgi:hypothetical protein